ncbi:MAG TPA: YCF48-related protein, partial [Nevskia sp.]|nr:YCF48-related protein [Nevskia sp.]
GVITLCGEFGLILRSGDAGKTWKTLHKGDASLFAMEVTDGGGYAVGQNGAVLHSTDHGSSWSEVKVGTGAILLGVHSADGKVLITGMHDMLLSRDNGQNWTHLSSEEINTTWYQGTGGGGGQPLLAVGHAGQIVRVAD